jgi:hypothetical protein
LSPALCRQYEHRLNNRYQYQGHDKRGKTDIPG